MKRSLKTLLAALLVVVLLLALISCTNKNKKNGDEWMQGDVEVYKDPDYAREVQQSDDDESVTQSDSGRIELPIVPIDALD